MCQNEGHEYIQWILHFHEWQPVCMLEHHYVARRPTGDAEKNIRERLGNVLFDFIDVRATAAAFNSKARRMKIYV